MKNQLLALLFALSGTAASAQSYNYLVIQDKEGAQTSVAAEGLKITFEDGYLVTNNGNQRIALSTLDKLYFSATETAIHAASTQANGASAHIAGGRLHVQAPAGTQIALYGTDGRTLSTDSHLTHGVYVVRVGSQTFKVVAK